MARGSAARRLNQPILDIVRREEFRRGGGASLKRGEIAIGKADAALAIGLGTRSITKMTKDRQYFITSVTLCRRRLVRPGPGRRSHPRSGRSHCGAVGISGDVSDNDKAAASAGIAAAGLTAPGSPQIPARTSSG